MSETLEAKLKTGDFGVKKDALANEVVNASYALQMVLKKKLIGG